MFFSSTGEAKKRGRIVNTGKTLKLSGNQYMTQEQGKKTRIETDIDIIPSDFTNCGTSNLTSFPQLLPPLQNLFYIKGEEEAIGSLFFFPNCVFNSLIAVCLNCC